MTSLIECWCKYLAWKTNATFTDRNRHASSEEAVKLFSMPDKSGYTALHYAFLPELKEEAPDRNQPSYSRSMLVNGKDTWVKNLKQVKAKLPSLVVEHEEFFVNLMQVTGLDVNVKSQHNETPLLLLCKSICTDEVASKLARRLLECNADPNIAVSSHYCFIS